MIDWVYENLVQRLSTLSPTCGIYFFFSSIISFSFIPLYSQIIIIIETITLKLCSQWYDIDHSKHKFSWLYFIFHWKGLTSLEIVIFPYKSMIILILSQYETLITLPINNNQNNNILINLFHVNIFVVQLA